jgi:urease accessory protein
MFARPVPLLERSHGACRLGFLQSGSLTRLKQLHQSGCAKAFCHTSPTGPEVVFLNTSGGMTGGDRLSYGLDLGPGCRVTATTQTSERAYRSDTGVAEVTVDHELASGAHLDWLPQETIFFDQAALRRKTTLRLAGDASCLLLEAGVLGRAAMGETVCSLDLNDRREVWRAGVPVLVEPFCLRDSALTAGAGILQGARSFASLALVAQGAEAALAPVRQALDEPGVNGGASGFDGRLMVRMLAADGWPLRRQILRVLAVLRNAPMPRVWQM